MSLQNQGKELDTDNSELWSKLDVKRSKRKEVANTQLETSLIYYECIELDEYSRNTRL